MSPPADHAQEKSTLAAPSFRPAFRLAIRTAAACVIAPAFAQDAPPPLFNWEGLYIGANLGAGMPLHRGEHLQAGSGFTSNAFDLYPQSGERAGVSFGAQAGYNWQIGHWVYGVETDLNLLDGRGGRNGTFPAPPAYWPLGVSSYNLTYETPAKYFASLRGRLGFAFDRALVYVTGGVAAGGARGPATLLLNFGGPGNPFTAPDSQSSRMKYILGAGAEYALAGNWSARLEYFFLNQSLNTHIFDNGNSFQYASRTRNENHILRFGLNYRFGENSFGSDEGQAKKDDSGKKKDEGGEREDAKSTVEQYSVHGQTTGILQAYPKFPALYSGPNSFPPNGQARFGSTTNLYLGLRLWEGAAAYVNPEIDEGFGLANSVGAAEYPNGAVAKVGRAAPYMRFQRYFVRQIIGLGGGRTTDPDTGSFNETLESTQNQLAGKVDRDRLILTVGKFAVGDVFDDNVYAHDPTTGFLNFAFNTMGSFDYAADAWGYTYGAALEWKQDWWTARGGLFQLSDLPNSPKIEPVLGRQFMGVAEFEARYDLFEQPGVVKFLIYGDDGYLNKVDNIVNFAFLTGNFPPDITNNALRKRRVKLGGHVNLQQQITPNLGFFLRAGMSDGSIETVDYTDVDRQVSFGLVASGKLWDRPKDEIGAAMAFSGLSGPHVRYFGLGGTSVYIGDSALAYGGEKVMETYYKYGLSDGIDVTLDYQFIGNPGHNLARGPVNVFGLRLHAQF
jgi:high affinity Mn2+ porin